MEKTMTALLECAGKPSPKEDLPACTLHKEGYDLYPQIHVDGFPGQAWKGYGGLRDYLNQLRGDIPGRCFAVEAGPGEVVLVPPGWAHCTISVDSSQPLAFGAWCVREYGFAYEGVRSHGGLAYFPIWREDQLEFVKHPRYGESQFIHKSPRKYKEFQIQEGVPIYTQFEQSPQKFRFIVHPEEYESLWQEFIP